MNEMHPQFSLPKMTHFGVSIKQRETDVALPDFCPMSLHKNIKEKGKKQKKMIFLFKTFTYDTISYIFKNKTFIVFQNQITFDTLDFFLISLNRNQWWICNITVMSIYTIQGRFAMAHGDPAVNWACTSNTYMRSHMCECKSCTYIRTVHSHFKR